MENNESNLQMDSLARRIDALEAEVASLNVASHQKRNQAILLLFHTLFTCLLTFLQSIIPTAIINGWVVGLYITFCIAFTLSVRPLGDRLARYGLSALCMAIGIQLTLGSMNESQPQILILLLLLSPIGIATTILFFRSFRMGWMAPDLKDKQPKRLSLLHIVGSMVVAAVMASLSRTSASESGSDYGYRLWITLVTYHCVCLLLVSMAIALLIVIPRKLFKVLCATLLFCLFLGLNAYASRWLEGYDLRQLCYANWNDPSPWNVYPSGTIQGNASDELSRFINQTLFLLGLIAPLVITVFARTYTGYRFRSGVQRRSSELSHATLS